MTHTVTTPRQHILASVEAGPFLQAIPTVATALGILLGLMLAGHALTVADGLGSLCLGVLLGYVVPAVRRIQQSVSGWSDRGRAPGTQPA